MAAILLFSKTSQAQQMVVSSYYNAGDPRDEWTEFLVIQDNLDIRNWTFGDNNAAQTNWQPRIAFNPVAFWRNLRAGTIIVVWHRPVNSAGNPQPQDQDPSDGFIRVCANRTDYFTGGDFGTTPLWNGTSLNVAAAGDIIEIRDAANNHVHALAHQSVPGISFASMSDPKLNHLETLGNNEAVFVCPGANLTDYGTPSQIGTTYTARSSVDLTPGLPNICSASSTANSDFWRSLRQPNWPVTTPTAYTVNAGNTSVTLSWPPVQDNYPGDLTTGYLILRNTTNTFTDPPLDGVRYSIGDIIGSATVIQNSQPQSQTTVYTDNISIPCSDGLYYRVYAFRYTTDNILGNYSNTARGRAYNETQYAEFHVTIPSPVDPTSLTADQTDLCAGSLPATITLIANGGDGETMEWFASSCSGTPIGNVNPLVIPAPAGTTTYFFRWNTTHCGPSACESVTVTVSPDNFPSVSIAAAPGNTVCAGTSVTVTATPVSSSSPSYQWYLGGSPVGANQATYTFVPATGDQISVEMTSVEPCSGSPVTSASIFFTVDPLLTPVVSITPASASVCANNNVLFAAAQTSGGTSPVYAWYLNGSVIPGQTASTYNLITPANGDQVYATLTSSEQCITPGNTTVSSNISTVSVTSSYNVSVSIAADFTNVCSGELVTFTATPGPGGSSISYEWYVGSVIQPGANTAVFTYNPTGDIAVYARLIDNATCAIGSPASSNTVNVTVTPNVTVGVSITADNTSVCSGTPVVFTATPAFPGTTPVYNWYVGGTLVSSGSLTSYTYNTPIDGEQVWVELESSETCTTSGNTVTSNIITLTVTQSVTPTVSLSVSPSNSICAGSTVTFTAIPTDEGNNPQYIFYINGAAQPPQTSNVFTWIPLNGNTFMVTLISDAPCATITNVDSGTETITVSSSLPVGIVLVDPGQVCNGSSINLMANPVNQGSNPVYEWNVNGSVIATTSVPTYTYLTPSAGETVSVRLINNESCATGSPFTSNTITLDVVSSLVPSVTVTASQLQTCSNSPVTFTAVPINEGTSPVYQWFVDGTEQIGISGAIITYSPVADISVFAVLHSDAQCASPLTAQSPTVVVTVTASYDVSVTAINNTGPVCEGTSATFSAQGVNPGPSPAYQWYKNGVLMPGETNIDYSFIPVNGEPVYVELTNNEVCANQHIVVSPVVTAEVNTPVTISVLVDPHLSQICAGEEVFYSAIPAAEWNAPVYQWFVNGVIQSETSEIFRYSPVQDDQVHAVLTVGETCVNSPSVSSADVTVEVITGPEVGVSLSSNAADICQGESVTFVADPLNEGTSPEYRWLVNGLLSSSGSSTFNYIPLDGDLVSVELMSSAVCPTNNPAVADEIVELSPCGFVLRMPTAFTPNNDLLNDFFKPYLGEILPSKYLLQIYNRWGEIVFETSDPEKGWDGTRNGEPVQRGIFVYKVTFEVPEFITNSLESPFSGTFMLIR
jgi:gliding motility-associated-like protein